MRFFVFLLALVFFEPSFATEKKDLENYWALSSLHKERRHPLEGVRKKGKILETSVWYEDSVVTKNIIPDQEIFCRFLHAFLYGKNTPRQSREELPPARAFRENSDIDEIDFSFFALLHQNKPSSPYWQQTPEEAKKSDASSPAQLRVIWTREERAVPFIRLKVNRSEWMSISEILKSKPTMGFTAFNKELCASIHPFLPRLSSSFADLDQAPPKP